jgi:hypothetical protein
MYRIAFIHFVNRSCKALRYVLLNERDEREVAAMLDCASDKALLVRVCTRDTTWKNLTLVVDVTVKEFYVEIINVARIAEWIAAFARFGCFLTLVACAYIDGTSIVRLIVTHLCKY